MSDQPSNFEILETAEKVEALKAKTPSTHSEEIRAAMADLDAKIEAAKKSVQTRDAVAKGRTKKEILGLALAKFEEAEAHETRIKTLMAEGRRFLDMAAETPAD